MAFARWYPTLITLDTGQLLILGGSDLSGNGVGYPEIYTPGAGWRTLTGAYIAEFATASLLPAHLAGLQRKSHYLLLPVAAGRLRDRSLRKWPSQRGRTDSGQFEL